MEISFSEGFKKSFRKRIKGSSLEIEFDESLKLFLIKPFNPNLKTHKLSGKLKGLWSSSVNYEIRVAFYFTKSKPRKAVFVDIGNHDQVY